MTIYRGPGGGGNADSDAEINALTALTNQALAYSETAGLEADAAAVSAAEASTSASEAATSASGAATSETNAAASASSASTSASSASTSATNAAASASSASTSATNAASSASAASTSATNAAASETNAAASSSTASTYATASAASAVTATTQASNAATSASAAAGSATTASTQASNAATSASGAATSATNASNSASAASTSAAAALASETAAAASVASIDPSTIVRTTGDQTIGGTKTFTGTITVPTPANATDASTKAYVDAVAQGLAVKESVRVATTAALPTNIYANGASGVGATLTAVAFGALTVDSVAMVLNDRILVKDEAAAANNGIYFVSVAGTAGIAYVLTRSVNMDTSGEFSGAFCFTNEGTVNNSAGFVCTSDNPITVGTTAINFTQFSGAGQIIAGNGITKSGNTLSINTAVTADLSTVQTLTNKTLTTPVLTGIPTAPTATSGTNNTQVATTAYVNAVTGTNGITGFKNRIINGAMVIDQRNAGASVTALASTTTFGVDRWLNGASQNSKFSVQQNAGSVTPPVGFANYLGVTSLSAYTCLAGDYFSVQQRVEGFNLADLGFGASGASPVTVSFWVRSSLTGSFGGSLGNFNATRQYPFSYTISAANTWEQKTITIAGDTTGTWNKTNTIGAILYFGLGYGTTYGSGTAGAWVGADNEVPTGSVSVVGTSGATFYITGVQLEKGSTATSFDYRPYGTELALCQRYYRATTSGGGSGNSEPTFYGYSTTGAVIGSSITFPVPMRAAPTISIKSGAFTLVNCATPSFIADQNSYLAYSSVTATGAANFQSSTSVTQFAAEL